jgi:DNA-binding GntR family transcriptional regulator
MTDTANYPSPSMPSLATTLLSRESGDSLVEQIVRTVQSRIDDKLLRTGARMPSIRQFSDTHNVSRFTVVEAYDRLVAKGFLESRRGSGFYVSAACPATGRSTPVSAHSNNWMWSG